MSTSLFSDVGSDTTIFNFDGLFQNKSHDFDTSSCHVKKDFVYDRCHYRSLSLSTFKSYKTVNHP